MKGIYNLGKGKTILLVEDDVVVTAIYRERFRADGFEMRIANCVNTLGQVLELSPVDLIILDLSLPDMDGIKVIQDVRSKFPNLPVVALGSAHFSAQLRAARAAGATEGIAKASCTAQRLITLVHHLLGTGPSVADHLSDEERHSFLAGGETEFQEKLATTFFTHAPKAIARLRACHLDFARSDRDFWRCAELSAMNREIRSVAALASLAGLCKITPLASALEALLVELRTKPAHVNASVIRTIGQAVDRLTDLLENAEVAGASGSEQPSILVVDDDDASCRRIYSALKKATIRVVALADTATARQLLEKERFGLTLVNLEMGQRGFDLCAKIRKTAANRTMPIMFVMVGSGFETRAKITLSGANDFIAKPFLPLELVVKALTWLFKEGSVVTKIEQAQLCASPSPLIAIAA